VQLENSFTVPVPVDEAWRVLLDIERIAPCMPGAAVDSVDGDDFTGRVKVKLGPINLTYQGKASFIEKDEAAHKAVIDARGKDQRGNGTAAATITANLAAEGSITRVHVVTDLNITGRPAQFGRGVMTDVGNKLLGQFADKLAAQLGEGDAQGEADHEEAAGVKAAAAKAAAAKAAATVTGAVEEVAASAEQVPGEGGAGGAVKKAAAATKEAAASATDTVELPTKAAKAGAKSTPAKAAPAKAAPAKAAPAPDAPATSPAVTVVPPLDGTPAATDTAPVASDTAPAATATAPAASSSAPVKAPSGPPSGRSGPPSRPATGGPVRSVPSGGPSRPRVVAEPEPIDLLEVAGGAALARYAAPAAGIAAAVVLAVLVVRRLRR
jgi:carbon monoxide dehydrogenase subunit G